MATQLEIANFIDVSVRYIRQLQNKFGLPTKDCDLQMFVQAYIKQLREVAAGRGSDGEYNLIDERARLAFHQANKTELEEMILRGDLIQADVVEAVWDKMGDSFRSKCLAIPSKLAPTLLLVDNLAEIQDELKGAIWEALQELADYDPEQYGINSNGIDQG